MKVLVTGATGLIGQALLRDLGGGRALSRDREAASKRLGPDVEVFEWSNPLDLPPPAEAFEGVDVIYHLAGAPVIKGRLTAERKAEIRESRVRSTRRLVEALEGLESRPGVLISASAVGFYGDRRDEQLEEGSEPGTGFLADVCQAWEAAAMGAAKLGVRVVQARLGIVLSAEGGALPQMLRPFKWGLGGRLGDGDQFMSWVHLDDAVGLLRFAASAASLRGPLNVVAPYPVTNTELTRVLAAALGRPARLPASRRMLSLVLGEMSEILLASQRVYPMVALDNDYPFKYEIITRALKACLKKSP
ncbi:TIGR01777 family oxidoreductase [Myxococcota bacterium]|nr:TIGR01777 family oxidoreductase [Myxococcota bacterium]MBU1431006.1 TIGR01777 family oxidoreductase [Myxococcota bacterium]MBU1898441.1 TIGR01777 family oxidoreductase [Myxococcota bacterium]